MRLFARNINVETLRITYRELICRLSDSISKIRSQNQGLQLIFIKNHLAFVLGISQWRNVNARRITTKQVQKAPPDDMVLEQDYEITANDRTINTSIQRRTDTSLEWMDDGCINLEESGDDRPLEEITYSPARANRKSRLTLACYVGSIR